jgi:putative glycosyltransferase
MKLSVVSTLYMSEGTVRDFISRIHLAATQVVGEEFEIILVDDGSPDQSAKLTRSQMAETSNLVLVELSKNFGHHKAIMAGLTQATGERVFVIDSDLEERPEWLLNFWETFESHQADVIFGVQISRKGGWFERASGSLFYSLFNRISDITIPRNATTARLMTSQYVDSLLEHTERSVFLPGLFSLSGFNQRSLDVKKGETSATTYSLPKKIQLAVEAITSFSSTPLSMIFYTGSLVFLSAIAFAPFLVFNWAFLDRPSDGWTSVLASIWLLGGLNILFVGVLGIYLGKSYSESKRRPNFIVKAVHKSDGLE